MWEEGTPFESLIWEQMGADFPYGLDPMATGFIGHDALSNETSLHESRTGDRSAHEGEVSTS